MTPSPYTPDAELDRLIAAGLADIPRDRHKVILERTDIDPDIDALLMPRARKLQLQRQRNHTCIKCGDVLETAVFCSYHAAYQRKATRVRRGREAR